MWKTHLELVIYVQFYIKIKTRNLTPWQLRRLQIQVAETSWPVP